MSKGKQTLYYKFKCTKLNNNTAEIKYFLSSYDMADGLGVSQPTIYNHFKNNKNKILQQWKIEKGKWDKYEKVERNILNIK